MKLFRFNSNLTTFENTSNGCAIPIVSGIRKGQKLPNNSLGMIFTAVNRTTAANDDECGL